MTHKTSTQNLLTVRRIPSSQRVSPGRHKKLCKVCQHPQRAEIEEAFIRWESPRSIAREFRLGHRSSLYRHANAVDLFTRRQKNLRAALEKIIERAGEAPVTAAAVVSAVCALSRINAAGEWVETSRISLAEQFGKMTRQELEQYAASGTLPSWWAA